MTLFIRTGYRRLVSNGSSSLFFSTLCGVSLRRWQPPAQRQQQLWRRYAGMVSALALLSSRGQIRSISATATAAAGLHTLTLRPFIFLGRSFLIGVSTMVGLVIYKLNEINSWISEHAETFLYSTLVSFVDTIQSLNELSWPSMSWIDWLMLKAKERSSSLPSSPSPPPSSDSFHLRALPIVGDHDTAHQGSGDGGGGGSGSESSSSSSSPSRASAAQASVFQEEFHVFIKRMIEIKQLLKSAGYQDRFKLPSIVVIGSQSSGKSSVLESIVGHEFLPKGSNMVTRRPLELTLVHTPEAVQDYAIFPSSSSSSLSPPSSASPYYDFAAVQRMLTDLNLAVPDSECISDSPIELVIYSRHVPDLTLIDLPGYIQLSNRHQPASLRSKIADLCDKYIQEPNIILAISAADVDIANSEALKASHAVDPTGKRTIGVITKMDLVDPPAGAALLSNQDYPLERGYIGVISKKGIRPLGHGHGSLLSSLTASSAVLTESQYFEKYAQHYRQPNAFGFPSLRRSLMSALENGLYSRLASIHDDIAQELDELDYQFKVQYNDRSISVDEYISHLMTNLKAHFQNLSQKFSRKEVRTKVQAALESKLLDIYERTFWAPSPSKPSASMPLSPFPASPATKTTPEGAVVIPFMDVERLDACIAALTKSNIGRLSCSIISDEVSNQLKSLSYSDPFRHHPQTMALLLASGESILKSRLATITNQIENAVKPFKYGTEFTPSEWAAARESAIRLMLEKEREANATLSAIQKEIGPKRLKTAIGIVKKAAALPKLDDGGAFEELSMKSPYLVQKANEALRLYERIGVLHARLARVRSSDCKEPMSLLRHQTERGSVWSSLASWIWLPSSLFWRPSSKGIESHHPHEPHARLNFVSRPSFEADPYSAGDSIVIWHDPCQFTCPEVYLQLLLHRLVSTTVLYLHYELVQNFLVPFPETIASSFAHTRLDDSNGASRLATTAMAPATRLLDGDRASLARFARENPAIDAQLTLQEKRANLQKVCESLSFLKMSGQATAMGPSSNNTVPAANGQPVPWPSSKVE